MGVSYDCVRQAMDRLRETAWSSRKTLVGSPGVRPWPTGWRQAAWASSPGFVVGVVVTTLGVSGLLVVGSTARLSKRSSHPLHDKEFHDYFTGRK